MSERRYDQYDARLDWQSMARTHSSDESETHPLSFWQTVIAHDSSVITATDDDLEKGYEANNSLSARDRITKAKTDECWEPVDEMTIVNPRSVRFETLMRISLDRRMVIITEDRIGLGPLDVKESDDVCILHEASRISYSVKWKLTVSIVQWVRAMCLTLVIRSQVRALILVNLCNIR